ncbi:MAG: glycosyltransferase family 39 protein [Patescibacteria group bacterium]|nr:glycosyltransferase family 39 protein [Patescibacteria group bacterium]
MPGKINRAALTASITRVIFAFGDIIAAKAVGFLILFFLILTRFLGLDWGLPQPLHPDERNMAVAVQSLKCDLSRLSFDVDFFSQCLNPNFFAYGQFPLYLAYFLALGLKSLSHDQETFISFEEATLSLRIFSATASLLSSLVILKIVEMVTQKRMPFWSQLLIVFSPFLIQSAHFGTTESLLILFYSLLIYLGILILTRKISHKKFFFLSAVLLGLSLATKVSSLIFAFIPFLFILKREAAEKKERKKRFSSIGPVRKLGAFFIIAILSGVFTLLFSPHYLLSFEDFFSALSFETKVATGQLRVFYTQQFEGSLPVVFQMVKIFPFALGPIYIASLLRIFSLVKELLLNRKAVTITEKFLLYSFFVYFLPQSFLFVKWSRFMAPVLPVLLIFGVIYLQNIKIRRAIWPIFVLLTCLPGVIYLSIYLRPDVRFKASQWLFDNLSPNTVILTETGNVVDLPLSLPNSRTSRGGHLNYQLISFDFYHLDFDENLRKKLADILRRADYIIVPSRRVFANYTCLWPVKENLLDRIAYQPSRCQKLKDKFLALNDYYHRLFSGSLEFSLVREFRPLSFWFFDLNDEVAEETWSVFDHPVIRIYKKTSKS